MLLTHRNAALALLLLWGCSNDETVPHDVGSAGGDMGSSDVRDSSVVDLANTPDLGPVLEAASAGPNGVGVRTVSLTDGARDRTLDVEVWYPSAAPGAGDVLDFEVEPNRTVYADLLAVAPDCPSRQTRAARDAALADGGPWPVVVFSHCHACMRYSSFTVAEQLASWGYVVVAPDHEDNTLFDELRGEGAALNTAMLETRAADIRFVLDEVLAGTSVPELSGRLDAERIGAMGHSFGSVTTGLVAQEDTRIKAALGLAAPMENPLLPGVLIAELDVPLMFLVAVEDNSIREIGNRLIGDNFTKATQQAYKVEVADAGHWSFSNIAGLTEMFAPGCGEAKRQTGPDMFSYLDVDTGRAIAAAYALAFFEASLNDSAPARRFLNEPSPWAAVTVEAVEAIE